ncbi:hypothetical protein [Actinoplanes sp. NPDC051859]|uniref:hypothetical protein n=1 Tax=Actinoplanes sp. NPDC051859 TaxID=3363909 RepID=UPI0037B02895
MEAYIDPAYEWVSAMVGPQSVVPWWAWVAGIVMILMAVLAPGMAAAGRLEDERRQILAKQDERVQRMFERL